VGGLGDRRSNNIGPQALLATLGSSAAAMLPVSTTFTKLSQPRSQKAICQSVVDGIACILGYVIAIIKATVLASRSRWSAARKNRSCFIR
jgi:hypothetical protein